MTKEQAKRELIDKKSIMNTLDSIDFNTDYECDEFGGNKVSFRTCDYDEVLRKVEYANPITEEEIVKPYLEKLKAKMQERDEDNGGEPLNAVDKGYHLACEHLFEEIDNLLNEKGEQK